MMNEAWNRNADWSRYATSFFPSSNHRPPEEHDTLGNTPFQRKIPVVTWAYVSFARWSTSLRTRYANRLDPEHNGDVRNVPVP